MTKDEMVGWHHRLNGRAGRNMGLPWRCCSGQGPHPVKTLEPCRFSRVASGFSKTTGISGFLLGWPWEAQSSPGVADNYLGGYAGSCSEKAMAPHSSTLAWKIPNSSNHRRLLGEIPAVFENPDATREKRRGSNVFTG